MIVSCHAHLDPPEWYDARFPQLVFDVEGIVEKMDAAGLDLSVFGNNWIDVPQGGDALDMARRFNDFAAEVEAAQPGRLMGLASTVPFGDDRFLEELRRAVVDLGLKGVMVNSSVGDLCLDAPSAQPFFELVCELDVPCFVHPPKVTVGAERMEIYRLPEMVGRPFDTTLSVTRFILSGGLERFPDLRMVCAHLGGALPMLAGRLDFGYELREDTSFGPWAPDVLTRPPSTYLRQLWVDTVAFHPPALMCALETMGADHLVMGTDCPPVPLPLSRSIDTVRALPIPDEQIDDILGGNAVRLLGLS